MIESLVALGSVFSTSWLVEVLRPYRGFILPGFFVGFFAVAFVAIALGRRRNARSTFVAVMFSLLIVFNFVAPMALIPFITWSQFSKPTPETVHHDEIRIVDANGHELKLDNRVTLAFEGISISYLTSAMVEQYDDEKNEEVARHLLVESRAYRQQLQDPSAISYLRYPQHGLSSSWTPALLREYDEFVGFRIYRMTYVTSPDGTEIERYEETMLLEVYPDGHDPPAPARPNTSPPYSMNRTAPNQSTGVAG